MNEKMTQYLGTLAGLENTKYAQDRILAQLNSQFARLGVEKKFTAKKKITFFDKFKETVGDLEWIVWLAFAVGLIAGWIFVGMYVDNLSGYKWTLKGILWLWDALCFFFYLIEKFLFSFIFGAAAALITFLILSVVSMPIAEKRKKKQNDDNDLELITNILNDQERVNHENEMKKRLQIQAQQVLAQRAKTVSALTRLYGLNIVDEEYRGLVPINSLYGYFKTGRCSELRGHEGAYNIYAIECRLDKIVTRMDTIISQLEDIRITQYELYNAVSNTNDMLANISQQNKRMAQSLDVIKTNSELTEFNTRASQEQLRAISNMIVFKELMRK